MSEFERQPVEVPQISINEGEMILNWFNTKIRTFRDTQFDHVEHRGEDDQLKGLRVTREFIDLLFEHEFPYTFDPIVDEATFEWFVKSQAATLDAELGEL